MKHIRLNMLYSVIYDPYESDRDYTLFQTPLDFLNLFVRPPGDLLYFLAIVALSQASVFMALGERWRRPENRDSGRYTIASLGIVIAWVLPPLIQQNLIYYLSVLYHQQEMNHLILMLILSMREGKK